MQICLECKAPGMELRSIKEFELFLKKVVEPSIKDAEKLDDGSRKHIQKLLFTNIVDRFDSTLDSLFLDNCRHPDLQEVALKGADEPITNGQLFKLLIDAGSIEKTIEEQLRSGIRQNVLRDNHSQKLRTFLRLCVPETNAHVDKPRVRLEGDIVDSVKPQKGAKMPPSIVGYADWLYSRRNSVVHGSGTSAFLEADKARLKKVFKVSVTHSKISLSSCKTALAFYRSLAALVEEGLRE